MAKSFLAIVSATSFSDIEVTHFIRENVGNAENSKETEINTSLHPEVTVNSSLHFLSIFLNEMVSVVQITLHMQFITLV